MKPKVFAPLRKLYHWTLNWSEHRWATGAMAGVAFAESSFFPIPPDVLLMPMALNRPRRAWGYAAICLVGSVVGGLFGYLIGFALFEAVGRPLLHFYGAEPAYELFREKVTQYDVWAVGLAGLTPIPYKIATIGAGAMKLDIIRFFIASVAARGGRFFLVATVCRFFGEAARTFLERYFEWVVSLLAVALIGGYIIIRFLL